MSCRAITAGYVFTYIYLIFLERSKDKVPLIVYRCMKHSNLGTVLRYQVFSLTLTQRHLNNLT
jgi:hypothetical protein